MLYVKKNPRDIADKIQANLNNYIEIFPKSDSSDRARKNELIDMLDANLKKLVSAITFGMGTKEIQSHIDACTQIEHLIAASLQGFTVSIANDELVSGMRTNMENAKKIWMEKLHEILWDLRKMDSKKTGETAARRLMIEAFNVNTEIFNNDSALAKSKKYDEFLVEFRYLSEDLQAIHVLRTLYGDEGLVDFIIGCCKLEANLILKHKKRVGYHIQSIIRMIENQMDAMKSQA